MYYSIDFLNHIRAVKEEGLLNLKTMSSAIWYRVLLEENVTHKPTNPGSELRPCIIERKHPSIDWKRSWSLATTPGLSSQHLTFLWKMTHDLLPTQARLSRLNMPNVNSEICSLCTLNIPGELTHSLLLCPYNDGAGQFLLQKLHSHIPNLLPQQVTLLDLDVEADNQLPLVYLVAAVLSDVWECRKVKKPCHLNTIRAALEAGINILRKGRHRKAAEKLALILAS